MYYDVSSSNTLQDKIKFVVLLFILYIVLQVSKGKGDYNNSEINQSFFKKFCSRLYARKRDYPLNRVFNVLRSTMLAQNCYALKSNIFLCIKC